MPRPGGSERGQGTVEYVGLLLTLALVLSGVVAFAPSSLPGTELARSLVDRTLCAIRGGCVPGPSTLVEAYGEEVAAIVEAGRPEIRFELGAYSSLPVDFRRCRLRACADTTRVGAVGHSQGGEQPTAFVHVVDCREGSAPAPGSDCDGAAAGRLYVQYWLYYPDSATRSLGRRGYHLDDWESFQLRTGAGPAEARASSHHGYSYEAGLDSTLSDAGIGRGAAWGPDLGYLWVSDGSHAGRAKGGEMYLRTVPPSELRIVPLDPLVAAGLDEHGFAVTPPWRKEVWLDPESTST